MADYADVFEPVLNIWCDMCLFCLCIMPIPAGSRQMNLIIVTSEFLVVGSMPVERYGRSWFNYLQAQRIQVLHTVGCGRA